MERTEHKDRRALMARTARKDRRVPMAHRVRKVPKDRRGLLDQRAHP